MTAVLTVPAVTPPSGLVLPALKDAVVCGVLAGLLSIPLLGLNVVDEKGSLLLVQRWDWVGWSVAAVMLGRFLLTLLSGLRAPAHQRQTGGTCRISGLYREWNRPVAAVLVGMAVAFPWIADRTWLDLGTLVLIYLMLAWGLSIVVGLAGLLDLGYVAFYAIGAYTFALLATNFGLTFWECLPLAALAAAAFGVLLGFPILRLRGDYLAIVTLGFALIINMVITNWASLTGGPNGISGIPRPSLLGLDFSRDADPAHSFHHLTGIAFSPEHRLMFVFYTALALALLINAFSLRIRKLPLGRAWEAMREDEIACRALGINLTRVKLSAYAIGAMVAGVAGCFFATRQGFISPDSFTFMETAVVLAIVVLGGMGSQMGILLACLFLVLLPEVAREFADYRMLLFGVAMVLVMVLKPGGLMASREPSIRLGQGGKA